MISSAHKLGQASGRSNTPPPTRPRREHSLSCQGCVLLSAGRSPPTPPQRADGSGVPRDATLPLPTPGSGVSCCCLGASPNPQLLDQPWFPQVLDQRGKSPPAAGSRACAGCGVAGDEHRAPDGLGLNAAPALEGCACTLRGCFPTRPCFVTG